MEPVKEAEKVINLFMNNKEILDSTLKELEKQNENKNEKEKERITIEACKHYLIIQNYIKIELKEEISQGIKKIVKNNKTHFLNESLKTLNENTEIIKNTKLFEKNDSKKIPIENYHNDYKKIANIFVKNVSFADRSKLLNELRNKYNELKCNNYITTSQQGGMKKSFLAVALVGIVSLLSNVSAAPVSIQDGYNNVINPPQTYMQQGSELIKSGFDFTEELVVQHPVMTGVAAGAGATSIYMATAPVSVPATAFGIVTTAVGTGAGSALAIKSLDKLDKSTQAVGDVISEVGVTLKVQPLKSYREAWGDNMGTITEILRNAGEYADAKLKEEIKPLAYIGTSSHPHIATDEQKKTYIRAKVLYKTTLELKGALKLIDYSRDKMREQLPQMGQDNFDKNEETIKSYLESDKNKIHALQKRLHNIVDGSSETGDTFNKFLDIMKKTEPYGNVDTFTLRYLMISQEEMKILEDVVNAMESNNFSNTYFGTSENKKFEQQLPETLEKLYEEMAENVYTPLKSTNSVVFSVLTGIGIVISGIGAMMGAIYAYRKGKPEEKKEEKEEKKEKKEEKKGGKKTKRNKKVKKNRTTKKRNRKNTKKKVLRKKQKKTRR